jgi:hypothetical protein
MTDPKAPMPSASAATGSEIDSATSAFMRKAIGERLGQHLGTDAPMPDRLQKLLDQLRLKDQTSS